MSFKGLKYGIGLHAGQWKGIAALSRWKKTASGGPVG